MRQEIEVKFKNVNLADLRKIIHARGGKRLGCRFERNIVFDDPARTLRARGVLLRLRDDGRFILTVKAPPDTPPPPGLKVRTEYESEVADFAALRSGLRALGYEEALRYEKVREEWLLLGCDVCLDHLNFGDFCEIEGQPDAIRACAAELGLDWNDSSTANYHRLYADWRAGRGLLPEDSFVFAGEARQAARELCPAIFSPLGPLP